MGQRPSITEYPADYWKYADTLFESDHWEGFDIDRSLVRFSGLDSTGELNSYRDHVLFGDGLNTAASTVEKLGSALEGASLIPNAVGLGALVISMVLEAVAKGLEKETLGTAEMLQRVFAHEKANEVRDLMDEYLKALRINLGHKQLQLEATRQIEADLSAQLTRLKNSMLKDGHLNTRLLKQWVNGAAFHTQVLIHQARLGGSVQSRPIQAAGLYQDQLNAILEKYKKYLESKIYVMREAYICPKYCLPREEWYNEIHFRESESSSPWPRVHEYAIPHGYSIVYTDKLVEKMFTMSQIKWAKTYFSDLQANVPLLVQQNSPFHVGI